MSPRRTRRRGGASPWRLTGYLLLVPWFIACSMDTSHTGAYYAALVVLMGVPWLVLLRRRPDWLQSDAIAAVDMVAWSLLVLLVLGELGTRAWIASGAAPSWLDSSPDPVRYRLDPDRAWLDHRPNALGFFDEPFGPRRPGVRRVVALGDSYTVGMVPYEENYVTRLDRLLGAGVEVLNLGVVHTAVPEYHEILRTEGLALEPDLVLLGIYIGNDIRPSTPRGLLSPSGSKVVLALKTAGALATADAPYLQALSMQGMYETGPDGERIERPLMGVEEHLAREWKHLRRTFREPQDDRSLESWADTEAAIGGLVAFCAERGLPVVATLAPDEVQVDDALYARVLEAYGATPDDFDRSYPNRRLSALLDELGVPCLDLLPALRAAEAEGHTYHLRAVHWNGHGNAAAAEALAPWLAERLAELTGGG